MFGLLKLFNISEKEIFYGFFAAFFIEFKWLGLIQSRRNLQKS